MNIKKFEKILDITKPKLIVHLAAQSLVDETINEKNIIEIIFWLQMFC